MKSLAAPIAALAILSFVFVGHARAELPFSHPAVAAGHAVTLSATAQALAASPLFIGHPSSPHWAITHANHEHPAVIQARLAMAAAVDTNTFLVQPPASVQWTLGPTRDNSTPVVARQ